MTEKMKSKMKSRRFWFTVWGATMATGVMIFSIITRFDAAWMPGTLALLVGIVTAYVAITSAKKNKEGDK